MNCEVCIKELDEFMEGKLPEDRRFEVEEHLSTCEECSQVFRMMTGLQNLISEEKAWQSNPFLSTRVLEALEPQREPVTMLQKIRRVSLVGISIAAAIFLGVLAGNVYKPDSSQVRVPEELVFMNDAALESVDALAK